MIRMNTASYLLKICTMPTLCIFPGIEPEATTAPEGGSYDSISALMIELRKKFPSTCILYKEHPNMQSMILDNELSMAGDYRNLQFLELFHSLRIYLFLVMYLIVFHNLLRFGLLP